MKKFLASLIIAIFAFTSFTFAYEDVPHDSPDFYAVEYLRRNDVFKDTKYFHPTALISKAEFIKYLTLLNSRDFTPAKSVELPYEDTSNTAWYSPYIHEAIQLGILFGNEGRLDPYKKITVLEALELLFHSQSIPIPRKFVGTIPYKDVERNKNAGPLVMRALEFDLISPEKPDYVGIYKRVDRALAARIIYRMDLVNLSAPDFGSNVNSFDPRLQKIINTWELINSNFINRADLDYDAVTDATIKALVDQIEDPYSAYLDKEENNAFSDDLDGEIEGIGAYIGVEENNEITIIAPINDSPADRAGIEAGDVVKKVDDVDITDLSLYEVVNMIKGPKGTTVKLTMDRNGTSKTFHVVRDVVIIKSLEYEVIENGKVMRINLSQFNQNASDEFGEVVEIIQGNDNIKGLIIDLRDNPGGLLNAAVGILNYLLPPDSEAVTIQYNFFNFTEYTRGGGQLADFPIVVLINKGSASASEIVAGALKDLELAKIVGETSFGKGTVQEVNYFTDSSSLKLTVAKWLTPFGHSIQDNGIDPDVAVVDATGTTTDEQLVRAIQELNKLINAR